MKFRKHFYKDKKFWFILSFIPVVVILIGCTISGILDGDNIFRNIINNISNFVVDVSFFIIDFKPISILFLACFIYQIWFLLNVKTSKINLKIVLLCISVMICLFILVVQPIYYYFNSYESHWFLSTKTYYGMEAFRESLTMNILVYSIIPVLPISIIIIIICVIKIVIDKRKRKK